MYVWIRCGIMEGWVGNSRVLQSKIKLMWIRVWGFHGLNGLRAQTFQGFRF